MCIMAYYSVLCGLVMFQGSCSLSDYISPLYYCYKIKERLVEAPRDSLGEFPLKNQMKRTRGLKST